MAMGRLSLNSLRLFSLLAPAANRGQEWEIVTDMNENVRFEGKRYRDKDQSFGP